jgi:hypothetical protein
LHQFCFIGQGNGGLKLSHMLKSSILLLFMGVLAACTASQINSVLGQTGSSSQSNAGLSTDEIAQGLVEALTVGIERSTSQASETDGYYRNPLIKIPFPPEIQEVEKKLRQLGLDKPVDDFVLSMNRAAEKAAAEAVPLFVSAIKKMTIQDARDILLGDQHAATHYLKEATFDELGTKYRPIVHESLAAVDATRYYETVTTAYNTIPFVRKVETDLDQYVTEMALDGLFTLVAKEEEKIRKDPVARTTDLLRKVFGQQ